MIFATISPGSTVTAADIASFDATWMSEEARRTAQQRAYWNLYARNDVIAWEVSERMTAMNRMYELTRDPRYLDHAKEFIDAALMFRDDRHPGDIHGTGAGHPPLPVDVFRGRVMPAWGGASVNRGGLHGVAEVVSSMYAYPIAAFARIVAEDPALHARYGADGVAYANAVLETVWAFMPQVGYRNSGSFVEAYLVHLPAHATRPTESECSAAYEKAINDDPDGDRARYGRMRDNCNNSRKVAGLPMSHNENLAFAMVLIELWRVLESAIYQQSPSRSADAAPTRALVPLLVSRQQRYFVNHLRTIADSAGDRYLWNHADDLPAGMDTHPEDTSHGALTMRYLGLLHRDFDRLNPLAAAVGEAIALDGGVVQRLANTFLHKIDKGSHFAGNVAGDDADPIFLRNGESDGWLNLTVLNARVYTVCHNMSMRVVPSPDPREHRSRQWWLGPGSHSALLMHKRYSLGYRHVERSRPFDAPPATGAPAGIVFAALGVENTVYRDAGGRIHELWQKGSDSGTSNLTALADNAIRATGDPRPFIATSDGVLVALYRGTDGHVHSLNWSTGAVRRDALSQTAGAPAASGNPVGFVQKDGTNVVIYRTADGHLHSLWWAGANRPGTEDLTAPSAAPPAAGDPWPYINTSTGENIIVYRGTDRHVHAMYWTSGAVGHDDLSDFAGAPLAAGDPVAQYIGQRDAHHVTYRSDDGHLHDLSWIGGDPVRHLDLMSAAAGAPAAASDPAVYYTASTGTKHVIYRSADNHLHEISSGLGGALRHVDLTRSSLAAPAADKPTAFTIEGPDTQHAIYRGTDNHIHEIRWN